MENEDDIIWGKFDKIVGLEGVNEYEFMDSTGSWLECNEESIIDFYNGVYYDGTVEEEIVRVEELYKGLDDEGRSFRFFWIIFETWELIIRIEYEEV